LSRLLRVLLLRVLRLLVLRRLVRAVGCHFTISLSL
jgi:hypothetical protein